jgi:dienelactone hydrolase
MPAEINRADYAVSANIGRTLDAVRQGVVDVRCCLDWLEQQGYDKLGIVGTSLGSCYAFIAAAHEPRIRVAAFNHASTYVADVVWHGQSILTLATKVPHYLCEVRSDFLARTLAQRGGGIRAPWVGSQGRSTALRSLHHGRDSV